MLEILHARNILLSEQEDTFLQPQNIKLCPFFISKKQIIKGLHKKELGRGTTLREEGLLAAILQ